MVLLKNQIVMDVSVISSCFALSYQFAFPRQHHSHRICWLLLILPRKCADRRDANFCVVAVFLGSRMRYRTRIAIDQLRRPEYVHTFRKVRDVLDDSLKHLWICQTWGNLVHQKVPEYQTEDMVKKYGILDSLIRMKAYQTFCLMRHMILDIHSQETNLEMGGQKHSCIRLLAVPQLITRSSINKMLNNWTDLADTDVCSSVRTFTGWNATINCNCI